MYNFARMLTLPIESVSGPSRRNATCVGALLHAIARDERAGRRTKRITEADRATWARFRGRLDDLALVELVLEDAAVTQPVPFDVAELLATPDVCASLPPPLVARWLEALPTLDLGATPADYITAQAKALGLPTRLNRSDLPKLKAHHRAVELPGTGGQIAFHIAQTQEDIFLHDVFTLACATPEEQLLAGLVAVECRVPGRAPVVLDPKLEAVRRAASPFDFVFALDPDKGGAWAPERLHELFQGNPNLRVVMV